MLPYERPYFIFSAAMNFRIHIPAPPLADFVEFFWYYEGDARPHALERVLPSATVEMIINLRDDRLYSYDRHDYRQTETHSGILISGPRSEYEIIDTACQALVMGIGFKAGGAFPFFGVPVCELYDIDLSLDTVWGRDGVDMRERLLEAGTIEARFTILEKALLARSPLLATRHPAVDFALKRLRTVSQATKLSEMIDEIGMSQRRFIQLFREGVGMTPKLFHRVRRFRESLQRIESGRDVEWADLALSCGYYDQAHFIRDFRAFSGINPSTYLAQRGEHFSHVPILL